MRVHPFFFRVDIGVMLVSGFEYGRGLGAGSGSGLGSGL